MKRGLILFLAVCTLAAAMVPRERRAVNTEEDTDKPRNSGTMLRKILSCAPQTACKWVIHNRGSHDEMVIKNSYCECSEDKECMFSVYDSGSTWDVYHCKDPASEDHGSEHS